jgi:DNA polymerase-3 subunit delta'
VSIFEVRHQPRAHRVIQRALASQRMPHAYIFAGPEGVGREMLASRLAKVLLCGAPVERSIDDPAIGMSSGADACGECQDCRLVEAWTHPDLFLIHRQLNRQHPDPTIRKQKALFLGVDVIRHFLVERGIMKPARGRAKVFIVREAERLNDASQNALLKTLEEPPPATFIILITSALDRMLPTTRSRCQQVLFQPLPRSFIEQRLASMRDISEAEAAFAATQAEGSLGEALRLLDDGVYGIKSAWGERLRELIASSRGFAPHGLARPFIEDAKGLGKCMAQRDPDVSDTDAARAGLRTMLSVLAGFYVDALRATLKSALASIHADQPEVIDALTDARSKQALLRALGEIASAETSLNRNANLDLTFEKLFIRLARGERPAFVV